MAQSFQPSAFQNSAFEVGYYVDLTKGTYTFTGNTVGVARATKIDGAQGAFTFTGNSASFARVYSLNGALGSFTITGGTSNDLDRGYKVFGGQGVYTFTGRADGGLRFSYDQTTGTFTFTGNAAALTDTRKLPLTKGTYTLSSDGVTMEYTGNYQISANTGSYFITGRNATFFLLRSLNGDVKEYVITGGAGNLVGKGYSLPLTKGAFTYTGNAANFSIEMPAEKGTYLVVGSPGARNITRNPLLVGTFTFTGFAANFTITMPAERGTLAVTGNIVPLRVNRRSFELNHALQFGAFDTGLTRTTRLPLAAGSFTKTGYALAFGLVRRLSVPQASYSFSGNTIQFGKIRGLAGDYGLFSIIDGNLQGFVGARLSFTERELDVAEAAGTIIIPAEDRIMEIIR